MATKSPKTKLDLSDALPTATAQANLLAAMKHATAQAASVAPTESYKMDVGSARERLNKLLRTANDDKDSQPVVVCDYISRVDFRAWLTIHKGELRRWEYEPTSETHGRVLVYSFHTFAHEASSREAVLSIMRQVRGGFDTLVAAGASTTDVGDRDQEPDDSIRPEGAPADSDLSVVIEVSYENQTWEDLVNKLERWMSPLTTVQVAIGVKIWSRKPQRRIIIIQRNRAFDEQCADCLIQQVVDFETAADAAAASLLPAVGFPLRLLYHGVAIPPELHGHEDDNIVIDLPNLLLKINHSLT